MVSRPEIFRKKTLLIVEDKDFNYLLLTEILTRMNYNVIKVEDREEAVE
jgi:CheY-like chemotaxis protein